MTFTWTKEASPRWDADKRRLLGPVQVPLHGPSFGHRHERKKAEARRDVSITGACLPE
jgi:hypothetical protein